MQDINSLISLYAQEGADLRQEFFRQNSEAIRKAAFQTALSIARGGKLLLCGNGGSAADAQHVAGEFVNRFLLDRPALPAVALTTDTSVITAIGNDLDYSQIFSRQVEALGRRGDVLFAISTSGNSGNVLNALDAAVKKEMITIGLTGGNGGKMLPYCQIVITVPDQRTPLIQEMHLAAEHLFCELVDNFLFKDVSEIKSILNPEEE